MSTTVKKLFPSARRIKRRVKRAIITERAVRDLMVRIRSRDLRESDVLLASFPRSGSRWLRFMLYNVLSSSDAEFGEVYRVAPFLGRHRDATPSLPGNGRLIQTHESRSFGPAGVVYLVRDPRSVVVSQYFLYLRRGLFEEGFDEFVNRFLSGKGSPHGSWGDHVQHWMNHPRLRAVVHFEEMRADTVGTLTSLVERMGVPRDRDSVVAAVERNTIDHMREKESRSPYRHRPERPEIPHIRKGSVDGWKSELTPEQTHAINETFIDAIQLAGYEV